MGYFGMALSNNDVSTDAAFRIWGSMISTKLGQCGLVQTTDTGQIDWVTVTKPPVSANAVSGYEIWRFNDSFQSTTPVFIKIEYGCGNNTSFPGIFVTISSGSNGSGTLTGTTTTRMSVRGYSPASAASACYFCGDTGRFCMSLWIGSSQGANAGMFFSIERTVDAGGNPTSEAVLVCAREGQVSGGWYQQAWAPLGPITAQEGSMGCLGPAASSASGGGQIGIFPVLFTKGEFYNPIMNVMGYCTGDITALSTISLSLYGSVHTFLPMGTTLPGPIQRVSGGGLLMRYES